jgi:putative NADH-flavin reductase
LPENTTRYGETYPKSDLFNKASIGLHVVNTVIEMGHQPVALVRNKRKVKFLPR